MSVRFEDRDVPLRFEFQRRFRKGEYQYGLAEKDVSRSLSSMNYKMIQGWTDFENIYTRFADNAPVNGIFVEIGSFLGKSICLMCDELKSRGKKIRVCAVDCFNRMIEADYTKIAHSLYHANLEDGDEAKTFWKNLSFFDHQDQVELLRELSIRASKRFEDHSIDFVFIDGCHLEPNVSADLNFWWPKVRVGGLMGGHDFTGVDTHVKEAVNRFFEAEEDDCFVPPRSWLIRKVG